MPAVLVHDLPRVTMLCLITPTHRTDFNRLFEANGEGEICALHTLGLVWLRDSARHRFGHNKVEHVRRRGRILHSCDAGARSAAAAHNLEGAVPFFCHIAENDIHLRGSP